MYLSKLIKVEVFVSVMDFIAVCCLVASHVQLFCNLMDCSLPDFSVHGISQARILEQVATLFSRESFQPRDQTCNYPAGRLFTTEPLGTPREKCAHT